MLCAYQFIYKYRRLKTKVIKTNFLGNNMPKENMHYAYIAYKRHPQIYLEKCKKKSNSDSGSGLEPSDLDSDLKSSDSGSNSDSGLDNFSYSVFSQLYLEIHFLREQFKYVLMVWLLISLAAALYFHGS